MWILFKKYPRLFPGYGRQLTKEKSVLTAFIHKLQKEFWESETKTTEGPAVHGFESRVYGRG